MTGLISFLSCGFAFAEDTGNEITLETAEASINEDSVIIPNVVETADVESNNELELQDIDDELESQEAKATTALWSQSVTCNGLSGISKLSNMEWQSSQSTELRVSLNNGDTKMMYLVK